MADIPVALLMKRIDELEAAYIDLATKHEKLRITAQEYVDHWLIHDQPPAWEEIRNRHAFRLAQVLNTETE
jgi:hypothetical protein